MEKIQQPANTDNYFAHISDKYADEITAIQPAFYENAARYIDSAIDSIGSGCSVLDIGNGGVINYHYEKIAQLYCVDLFVSKTGIEKYAAAPNIHFFQGNMLDMKELKNNSFDAIIVQTVIHHLAGKTLRQTEANVEQGLYECMRVLKPDGLLLIVESTVFPWFEALERVFFPILQAFFSLIKFDTVYQYSRNRLINKLTNMGLNILESDDVGMDQYIWLCRKKVLTKNYTLPCLLDLRKKA